MSKYCNYTTYEHSVEHFIFRLKERCDIDITEKEYDELVKNVYNNSEPIYKINCTTGVRKIKIKDNYILVIYQKAKREKGRLKTVLIKDYPLPTTLKLKKRGIDNYKFMAEIRSVISKAKELIPLLKEMGYKKFFTEVNEPFEIKALTKVFLLGRKPKLRPIIKYIESKYIK